MPPRKKPATKPPAKTPAARHPDAAQAKALPGLLRSVLQSPRSEAAVKSQLLGLAAENLHVPEVVSVLLESLPAVKDRETRDALLGLLGRLETSRFESVAALHDAFLGVLRGEKDRQLRAALLSRLQEGLHQDPRLAGIFLSILSEPILNDAERRAAAAAVASLPSVDEATVVEALGRGRQAAADVQETIVGLAERLPSWSEKVVQALRPWLDVKVDRALRLRILNKLAAAKALSNAYVPLLGDLLRQDPDAGARGAALDLVARIRPWDEEVLALLLWTSGHDASPALRKRALALQGEGPELSELQLESMARRLSSDRSAGVRVGVLAILKDHARVASVRAAAAEAFASNPGAFDDEEFGALVDFLAPYAGRDAKIRDLLFKAAESLPRAPQRNRVLGLVLPKIKPEQVVAPLVRLFAKERDASIRATLFGLLRPLSIARHPELVEPYCAELVEPSSPFRLEVAGVLSAAAESHDEVPPALEDVLANDTDRELLRTCLDGYLRPKVEKSFDVLLGLVRNEGVDTGSRQRCLEEVLKLDLSAAQRGELERALSGLKPDTLRLPS